MKKKIALFMAAALFAPSAFAMEITPYVGLGIVADSANTSAKRVKFDASNNDLENAFVPNAGGNMDFDMAFAGEITAGVKLTISAQNWKSQFAARPRMIMTYITTR